MKNDLNTDRSQDQVKEVSEQVFDTDLPTLRAGERFRGLYRSLNLSQASCAAWLCVTVPTISAWCKTEPRFLNTQIQAMVKCGVNPLYVYGSGEMVFSYATIDYAITQIKKRIS